MKQGVRLTRQTKFSVGRRIVTGFLAGGIVLGLLILIIVPPPDLPFAACAFHSVTGHSCLTCGLTRSMHALLHGELSASLRYHLFGPVVFACISLCLAIFSTETICGKRFAIPISREVGKRILMVLAISWFAYWGIRLVSECVV